jgi:hypothetical protein
MREFRRKSSSWPPEENDRNEWEGVLGEGMTILSARLDVVLAEPKPVVGLVNPTLVGEGDPNETR